MRSHTIKGLALVAGALLVAVALSVPANAASLRNAGNGAASSVTGGQPGSVLWTYFDTCASFYELGTGQFETPASPCNTYGFADNIIHLINPKGGSSAVLGSSDKPVCANIYVFDDDQEMVACCSCDITSNGLATISVDKDLLVDPILSGGAPDGIEDGSVAIVASPGSYGCYPGGYDYSPSLANLLGSISHVQTIKNNRGEYTRGFTEVRLNDDAGGDASNVTYLQEECTNLLGNGSGAGYCYCPAGSLAG